MDDADVVALASRVGWLRLLLATLSVAAADGASLRELKMIARVAKLHGARTRDVAKAARTSKLSAWRWCNGIADSYQRTNVQYKRQQ